MNRAGSSPAFRGTATRALDIAVHRGLIFLVGLVRQVGAGQARHLDALLAGRLGVDRGVERPAPLAAGRRLEQEQPDDEHRLAPWAPQQLRVRVEHPASFLARPLRENQAPAVRALALEAVDAGEHAPDDAGQPRHARHGLSTGTLTAVTTCHAVGRVISGTLYRTITLCRIDEG